MKTAFLTRRAAWAACLGMGLALGCARRHDPTLLLAPQAGPALHGATLTLTRAGDGIAAVTHVWVENGSGADILTLSTTDGQASYSCVGPDFCACSFEQSYWAGYCAANPTTLTDANSHATSYYNADTQLSFGWNWTDRSGAMVPDGTYKLRAEVSGYNYGAPSDATVTVTKNGASGTATGVCNGVWLAASASWAP